LVAVVVLVALSNRFGQHPTRRTASAPAATVTLCGRRRSAATSSFNRVDVRAARTIDHPRLVLDSVGSEGMQVNSTSPLQLARPSGNGRVVLSYDTLEAGDLPRAWLLEVNPTDVAGAPTRSRR
jgi:hypothetical protein